MACFLVPAAEAAVVTIATKISDNNEKKEIKPLFRKQVGWLKGMLWGGSALLAFEHVWHGELEPWFPFLTAASNPADRAAMLGEMGTTGIAMAGIVTAVWTCMVLVTNRAAKKKSVAVEGEQREA